jgi:hypothetical protein
MWLWNLWRLCFKLLDYHRPLSSDLEDFDREDDPVTTAFEIGCLIFIVAVGAVLLAARLSR